MNNIVKIGKALMLIGIWSCVAGCSLGGGDLLSPAEFNSRIHATTQVQLMDVRTPEEFAEGYIKGAVNIDFNGENFAEQIQSQTKSMAVYVYCRSGRRSAAAAEQMGEMGFTQVFDLDGGILGWKEKGMPISN